MSNVPDRATFEQAYAGKAPWDIGKPQAPFVGVADRVTSPVLDAGCGTGDTALFFAARGHRVTGIAFVEEAIRRARAKAAERGLAVEFLVKDALTLGDWGERFASLIDSGLFHVFSHDDRRRYVQGLAQVIEPGGRLFLMCGSAEEARDSIPPVSRQERWTASSIRRGHQIGGPRCPRGTPAMNFELIRGMLVLRFLPERPSIYGTQSMAQDRAVVQTTLVDQKTNGELPVEYRLIHQGQRWAVFDVIVDEVSLALNYRAQFDQIIQRSSYDTVLHRIKSKAEEGSSQEHMEKLGIMPRRATPRPPCRGTIA